MGRKSEMKTKMPSILIEPSVHERLRVQAFHERCSVGEVIRRAVEAYLGGRPRERVKKGGE